jgi:hypothetical protein
MRAISCKVLDRLRSTRSLGYQINISCRPSNIGAPVMSVDGISLVEIEFEEFVVSNAFEVLYLCQIVSPKAS